MLAKKFKCKYNLKMIVSYGIFGVLTTVVNIIVYKILIDRNVYYITSNVIAFILSIIFAYITNKKWVFYSETNTNIKVLEEFVKFSITRITTFLFDFFGMIFLIEVFHFNKFYSKIFVSIVVIILNYLFSKKVVFRNIDKK
ncbi:GtrA family protein [Clostridiaceae bacterium UIB06]|uniref:GtrA family protein n=1 Tax=Clostridium thailandense TaxID=2794346 RepID=A0A949X5J6_9CLOT|nr:GtrA family protein [Clostridium thailandense]MBV7275748.1 GtrA family protein [Clostridium thailandense]MCH5136791.1 GtrA family protein [Clostridiaceae bacterium UIB06]